MRVLMAMAGALNGGAEDSFARMAIALAERIGPDLRLVTRPSTDRDGRYRAAGIVVTHARFGGLFDRRTSAVLHDEIDNFSPDIVLTWANRATRFCRRRGANDRFAHVGSPRGFYDLKYYRHCDHIMCNTDDTVRFYTSQGWAPDRITRVQNIIDGRCMPALSRSAFDTPPKAPLVLGLGRLHVNKAFDTLLDAVAQLPEHWLWLGGEGPEAPALRSHAKRLGITDRVRFIGWRRDVPAALAACDMFVCPSRLEPFGNVFVEAWAQKRAVVATNTGGPGDIIEHERSGLLVPVDDAKAMASAIDRLTSDTDLRARLVEAAYRHYQKDYTETVVIDRLLALFESLSG